MIEEYIGADKETIRAYKGYHGHIRQGRCGDNRIVGLSRKGYLEKFGFLKKIPDFKWQVCQLKLNSEDIAIRGDGFESNQKISISPIGSEVSANRDVRKETEGRYREKEEEDTEKERNFTPKIYENERRVFNAVPFAEPDRVKTNLRRVSTNG